MIWWEFLLTIFFIVAGLILLNPLDWLQVIGLIMIIFAMVFGTMRAIEESG